MTFQEENPRKEKKGELCKVLFYSSLKNHIMLLFMSDKTEILKQQKKNWFEDKSPKTWNVF